MIRVSLIGRLATAVGLLALLAIATAAPALPAQPDAGTISTGTASVWNGHSCSVDVPVNIAGLNTGLGGYETKVGWDPARFSSANADVTIALTPYLTNGGTRFQTGASGTPALKAVTSGAVKFGGYSWGTGNPPGNSANGQLATVSLKPTATCGAAALTMSETQLVDVNGTLIGLTGQTGSNANVYSRFDVNGSQPLINSGDVNAVVAMLGASTVGCDANYRYNTNLVQTIINSGDVNAVVAKLGQTTIAACVN
ncbi:MAG: hypothetical protein HZY76_09730 [Anaerolineae bacterium]|nr:MAG: hypothetical protein HZY76_09730 [Anaerolineae bacterium]